jgi:uncharacterized lipoprotein
MKQLITLSLLILMLGACSDSSQQLQYTADEPKDCIEEYYELEEVRYEEYLKTMAG